MVTDHLADLVKQAVTAAIHGGRLPAGDEPEVHFERPKRKEHGDWSTNLPLTLPKEGPPREAALAIVELLPPSDLVERVEVAGPGFINFYLAPAWLHDVVKRATRADSGFGRPDAADGQRINVEFVSANPTGPINVVSGRHAAFGDSLANILAAAGNEVIREFYVNDMGRQIKLFGASIAGRYLQELGQTAAMPEDGYLGDYVTDLARSAAEEHGPRFLELEEEERTAQLAELGLEKMLEQMRASLEAFGTKHDLWIRESSLHESGGVQTAISELKRRGFIEEKDGALWFLSSRLGDDKDRVVVRQSGDTTYLAPDLAYLNDKFGRGFDHLIYVLGSDHHGTVPRMKAAAEALGHEREAVEILLVQVVTLSRGSDRIKASKRKGVFVPLQELVDEVGKDAARYMFLTRSIDAPLDFDIELAKEQAPENPVYYVQYAHARICSILRRAAEGGIEPNLDASDLSVMTHPSEEDVMRKLAGYEELIPTAAELRAPQRVTRYVEELASLFSAFYRDCKVVTDDAVLTQARLNLCVATKNVIADALGLVGVSAPERM
ncbi:MAG: arginine--tRNA ligase [Actinomycetota bacterium]|nr:arginine--tRNA ligase [Actinomycetota bacterium]